MIPSAAELSVLIGVGGWGIHSSLILKRRVTAVFPLWKISLNYALVEEATTCLSIMLSVWIDTFSGGGRCVAF